MFCFVCLSVPLFCASNSLSELETDIKVFKDSLLKILDEDEIIEEFCLTKWTDPRVLYVACALTYTYMNAKRSSLKRSFKALGQWMQENMRMYKTCVKVFSFVFVQLFK